MIQPWILSARKIALLLLFMCFFVCTGFETRRERLFHYGGPCWCQWLAMSRYCCFGNVWLWVSVLTLRISLLCIVHDSTHYSQHYSVLYIRNALQACLYTENTWRDRSTNVLSRYARSVRPPRDCSPLTMYLALYLTLPIYLLQYLSISAIPTADCILAEGAVREERVL